MAELVWAVVLVTITFVTDDLTLLYWAIAITVASVILQGIVKMIIHFFSGDLQGF